MSGLGSQKASVKKTTRSSWQLETLNLVKSQQYHSYKSITCQRARLLLWNVTSPRKRVLSHFSRHSRINLGNVIYFWTMLEWPIKALFSTRMLFKKLFRLTILEQYWCVRCSYQSLIRRSLIALLWLADSLASQIKICSINWTLWSILKSSSHSTRSFWKELRKEPMSNMDGLLKVTANLNFS